MCAGRAARGPKECLNDTRQESPVERAAARELRTCRNNARTLLRGGGPGMSDALTGIFSILPDSGKLWKASANDGRILPNFATHRPMPAQSLPNLARIGQPFLANASDTHLAANSEVCFSDILKLARGGLCGVGHLFGGSGILSGLPPGTHLFRYLPCTAHRLSRTALGRLVHFQI